MWSEFSKILRNNICLFKHLAACDISGLSCPRILSVLSFYIAEEFFETNSIVFPKVDSHFYLDPSSLVLIFLISSYFSLALTLTIFSFMSSIQTVSVSTFH